MTIAALYDIHGNLPALEAVLSEIHQLAVDQIVVGGDVILGPFSSECLDILLDIKIPIHFIQGNCEVIVLEHLDKTPDNKLPQTIIDDIRWTANQLKPSHREIITNWPKTISFDIDRIGSILFCHATPRDENENFTILTSQSKIIPAFEQLTESIVVCGHTHMQFDHLIGSVRVINAGSIGMPFGKTGADWLLLGKNIEHRHTSYNLIAAKDAILKSSYPGAKNFVENYILNPPSESEMMRILS